MEQFRQVGEVLGSLKALMVFEDNIRINARQCRLLVDAFGLAFDTVAAEIKDNLCFDERSTKWKALEQPLRELQRVFKDGEQYVRACLDAKDWWVKAISLSRSPDCVESHLHSLLWCVPVVVEAIEAASEISGCDHDEFAKKRVLLSKKYEKDWMDPELFRHRFGKQFLISNDLRSRLESVAKEDRWILLEMIGEKKSSGCLTKQDLRLAELLLKNNEGKLFPTSILVGSKDYQVRRRLGNGSHYKEVQWMGESFAVKHFFGEIEPLIPEISVLSSLAHPNVMQVLCAFSDDEKKECFLLMELMSKDLATHIKENCGPRRRIPFSLPVAVDTMLQIARGMEYLHSKKLFHGNLDPSNILVKAKTSNPDGYLHVKIMGHSPSMAKNRRNNNASSNASNACIWYAPEVLEEQEQSGDLNHESKYTEKADVYSFSMICFELLTGKVPFEDGHLQGDKTGRNIRMGERPLFPFPSRKYLTNLTKKCWHSEPAQRPSFASICRVLRYVKRFLALNIGHSQPDPPLPPVDYCEVDASLARRFGAWSSPVEASSVAEIPFQMFAYRVMERERTNANLKEKSSESGSESTSVDENVGVAEEAFSNAVLPLSKSPSENHKKAPSKRTSADGKANRHSGGQQQKGKSVRPPQLVPCGRSLRMNSESQLQPVASPGRRRTSGHASDSELA
ncbi:Light-sensor Protein kinase [Acorus calamus]|uniref:Light-sensor Protein kinase n=1 Tax=Acorus calamus TaxID=4465 RepID=A0AAV9FMP1_ACOCL|nr:Light-sensor Protein kinase [Acorus calamus]